MALATMYNELYKELFMTKQELESRLKKRTRDVFEEFAAETLFQTFQDEKKLLIEKHIQDDLADVKRALAKIELGVYGICEETGQKIPYEKLRTIPTARSIYDFNYDLVRM
jgi:DnaK suppressor protein